MFVHHFAMLHPWSLCTSQSGISLGSSRGIVMNIIKPGSCAPLKALLIALALLPVSALADSGFYIGGSFGNAGVDLADVGVSEFDEDDSAFKAFLGYRLDLPSVFVGIEGGYVDLGEPEVSEGAASASVDPTGLNLFGIAGLEAGPVDLFVKAGYIAWDVDVFTDNGLGQIEQFSDDGSDLGYGLGLAFGLGPVQIRGEYEMYDIEEADVTMISVGFSYLFD